MKVSGWPFFLSGFSSASPSSVRRFDPIAPLRNNYQTSLPSMANDHLTYVNTPRRINRPGMNSYLKILFENDDTMSRLHSITANLRKEIPKLRIRSLQSLHMTFFFGGEILCNELSIEELHHWHTQVQTRFAATSSSSSFTAHDMQPDFWFQFAKLRTFPPHRNNLIVAEFEASPAWHVLYNDLQNIARDDSSPGLQELATTQPWIPHVTLANLPRPTQTLNRLLEDASNEFPKNERIFASGIGMGGPVPRQDELNWSFIYGGSGSTS